LKSGNDPTLLLVLVKTITILDTNCHLQVAF
jgi:hypothetical protein